MKRILEVCYNELLTIFRDKGILVFVLSVPLFYPLLYTYIYKNETTHEVPVAVVDESHSAYSKEFVKMIDATPDVNIVAKCADLKEAQEFIKRGKVFGILHIPKSFSKDIYRGDQTTVALYCDMGSLFYYKSMLLSATNVSLELNKNIRIEKMPVTTQREAEIAQMPIDYNHITLYNPQGGYACFLIPPVLILILQQTMILGIAMSVGRSREQMRNGNLTEIPSNPFALMFGKALLYFVLYMLLAVYMFTIVPRIFGLMQLAEYKDLLLFSVPYLVACVFMSFFFSSFIYRREDCILLFVFMSLPLLFLSGVSWPLQSIPLFWRYFSYLFPSSFAIHAYVRLQNMGASIFDVWNYLAAMWVQAAVYFVAACVMYVHHQRKFMRRNNGK